MPFIPLLPRAAGRFFGALLLVFPLGVPLRAEVLIHEILYHPAHAPETSEPVAEEFIELRNTDGANAVALSGWRLSSGARFTFPAVTIPAGGYVVVASDPVTFAAKYPDVSVTVLGPWTGRLSNSGERIALVDSMGTLIDEIAYADDGDWALRRRGVLDNGHRGWVYTTPADGEVSSLELVDPSLSNAHGQNWAASAVTEVTPGAPNSVGAPDGAPMILEVKHSPAIPSASDLVRVRAELVDASVNQLSASVYFRISTLTPEAFATVPMFDDGLHGDGAAGDKEFAAYLLAHADGSVVEY